MATSDMQLVWISAQQKIWNDLLQCCPQANWMQSYAYARAMYSRDFKATRFAKIQKGGLDLGILAVQEIRLGPVHFIEINRGPLWFQEEVSIECFTEFVELLCETFPKRILRRLRWLPEWAYSEEAVAVLLRYGMKFRPQTFETVVLNLRLSEESLRASLYGKWRNCLRKAESLDLSVDCDFSGRGLDVFLNRYDHFKTQKDFQGPSIEFLKQEFLSARVFGQSFLLTASRANEPVAGVMIVIHGKNASYRAGWNSEMGKKSNAHYLLLWTASKILKEKSINKFDLGGVKTKDAPSLTHFKQGMGGEQVKLLGLFS